MIRPFASRTRHADAATPATTPSPTRERRGFAMLAVLLISMVGAVLALATAMLTLSGGLVQSSSDRAVSVDDVALSGVEEERSRMNARLDTVPLDGYRTIVSNAVVPNSGGIRRSTWISRLGNSDSLATTGEFGVQAEVVSQATDSLGNTAIRRTQMYQESFARYASFTDQGKSTSGATLWWALGAQAQGPVHSNDTIYVWNGSPTPQAIFNDVVTTAKVVKNKTFAQYNKGQPQERISRIPLPGTADLNILKNIATNAGYMFTPDVVTGDSALVTMRIEFVAVDADGDGNTTGPDDGYFRVYKLRAGSPYGVGYAMARTPDAPPAGSEPVPSGFAVPVDSILYSWNCGVVTVVSGRSAVPSTFAQVASLGAGAGNYRARMINKQNAYDNANSRCFLGGDERLSPTGIFRAVDSAGYWVARTSGSVPATVSARADGAYLWPLSAGHNPNFRGVIFAEGKVGVSGVVRGRVTVAARNSMVIVHELTQATSPGVTTGTCRADDDAVGLFSGDYIMYSDNMLATPQQRRDNSGTGNAWLTPRKDFDWSSRKPDMAIHASMMALKSVAAERSSPPAGTPASRYVTRGTTRLIGGTIESSTGQTGTMSGANLHGYYDDLSFNRCFLKYPPPYFPTTGRWTRSQFFEINPRGFTPAAWFSGR